MKTSIQWWSVAVAIVAAVLVGSMFAIHRDGSSSNAISVVAPTWGERTKACRSEVAQVLKVETFTTTTWNELSTVCYNQVRGEAILADFDIRRSNLIGMQADSRIVLWMVVAITISGVGLAGLQLFAAYKLAGAGRGELAASQELVLEQNKVSVKSSVTGLLILIVSFAFFMVYVYQVYGAKELNQGTPDAGMVRSMPANVPTLGVGGYGPPPAAVTRAPVSPTPAPNPAQP